jgi:hypothetical protein
MVKGGEGLRVGKGDGVSVVGKRGWVNGGLKGEWVKGRKRGRG